MKNVALINAVDFEIEKSCNPFSSIKESEVLKSKIVFLEKHLSDKLNAVSSGGRKLQYQRKYKYDIIGNESNMLGNSEFGAYFFSPNESPINYKVCIGPVVEIPVEKSKGCSSGKTERESEKEKGCNESSEGKKSPGCNPSITGGQYLNFYNDQINSGYVKSINEKKGWRTTFNRVINDFTFTSYFSWNQTALDIDLSKHYDLIINSANDYVENLRKEGFNYECKLNLPYDGASIDSNVLENVILCSNVSKQGFYIERSSSKSAHLSAFDLLYVSGDDFLKKASKIPKIGGFFESLRTLVIFLKKIFGSKISGINQENITQLEELYSKEFAEQLSDIESIENLKANRLGSINVFVLVPLWKNSFELKLKKFFKQNLHKRLTFQVDLTKK